MSGIPFCCLIRKTSEINLHLDLSHSMDGVCPLFYFVRKISEINLHRDLAYSIADVPFLLFPKEKLEIH